MRRDIVLHNGFKFESGCQKESVPSTLKTFVSMLLNGANLKHQDSIDSQASLTISQSILFNFKKCASSSSKSRHSLYREPPLPLYIGMMIHTETRSKKTVTELHDMGLSVSYDRILQRTSLQLLCVRTLVTKEFWFLLSCSVECLLLVHLTT